MAGVLVDEKREKELKELGVKDSKLLSPGTRAALFDKIKKIAKKYKIISVSPAEIDEALGSESLNLNWLEAQKGAEIINALKPDKAIVDSPSTNCISYKIYIEKLLDNKKIEMIVENKADVNYVSCAAASILAKVTRDEAIEKIKKEIGSDFGSGYPADPKTKLFLEKNYNKHHEIFRKTWATFKKAAKDNSQSKLGEF